MNVLALKGEVYEMLVEVRTEKTILKIREFIRQALKEDNKEDDLDISFSKEQNEQLKQAIAESRMPENRIPYEEIKQEFAEWFKK
jgi:predicted CopG family antitoxin